MEKNSNHASVASKFNTHKTRSIWIAMAAGELSNVGREQDGVIIRKLKNSKEYLVSGIDADRGR